jgi:hypothetical protein
MESFDKKYDLFLKSLRIGNMYKTWNNYYIIYSGSVNIIINNFSDDSKKSIYEQVLHGLALSSASSQNLQNCMNMELANYIISNNNYFDSLYMFNFIDLNNGNSIFLYYNKYGIYNTLAYHEKIEHNNLLFNNIKFKSISKILNKTILYNDIQKIIYEYIFEI